MKTWQKIMIVSVALAAVPGTGLAECPSYPDVSWWGAMNHDKAIRYVDKKHGGDWAPYMAKWRRQLARLEKIQAKGGAVVFKKKSLRLKGEALDDYVLKVRERVSVNTCLAEEQLMANAEKLAEFPTAAGSRN